MAIKQKITVTKSDGSTPIPLHEWVEATLPPEEVPLFYAAQQRHHAFVEAKAVSIDMQTGETIFADEAKKNEANPLSGDMDFLIYWYRYLVATGATVNESTETV